MLRTILQHRLLAGATEVLLDALRYLTVMAFVIMLLGQLVKAAGV